MTTASTATSPRFAENRFLQALCAAFVVALILAAYHPDTQFDLALENAAVTALVLSLIATYRTFKFSDLSYLLIFVYLCLHEYGAHYKYSDVPLGEWLKPLLHTKRNHYDRIVHFSFGFLLAYPMREVALRAAKVRGAWQYFLPVEATLSFSAIYEMLEALAANLLTPERGEEFVGMQGDMWDSQEDMFMAGLGATLAVLILAAILRRRDARRVKERAETYAAVE